MVTLKYCSILGCWNSGRNSEVTSPHHIVVYLWQRVSIPPLKAIASKSTASQSLLIKCVIELSASNYMSVYKPIEMLWLLSCSEIYTCLRSTIHSWYSMKYWRNWWHRFLPAQAGCYSFFKANRDSHWQIGKHVFQNIQSSLKIFTLEKLSLSQKMN